MKRILFLFGLVFFVQFTFAQENIDLAAQENAIKEIVIKESTAWANRDYNTFISTWAHKPYSTWRAFNGRRLFETFGWDEINKNFESSFKNNPDTLKVKITRNDFVIHVNNNMAWISFIANYSWDNPGRVVKLKTQESRSLIKENGQWKILTLMVNYVAIDDPVLKHIQEQVNSIANQFIKSGKTKEAIEVFKLNNKLFPEISATYDDIAWGYMNDGNNEEAIKWAKKSLEMIPKDPYSEEWEKERTERRANEKIEKLQGKK